MTVVQAIVALSLTCLLASIGMWLVVIRIKHNRKQDRAFKRVISDPAVRSLIYQLIRNQYTDQPCTSDEKRSNNRRALAMIRLRRVVTDPKMRQKIYQLTDKSKW